jgi:hypothetical protein
MKAYADIGGRVFASHWHNIWIGGATWASFGVFTQTPAVWSSIATWALESGAGPIDLIDEVGNPKGAAFATWMLNVMGSTTLDQIPLQAGTERSTPTGIVAGKAERWTYAQSNNHPQNFQFTTPNEMPPTDRCGKVVQRHARLGWPGKRRLSDELRCGHNVDATGEGARVHVLRHCVVRYRDSVTS